MLTISLENNRVTLYIVHFARIFSPSTSDAISAPLVKDSNIWSETAA